ncbi:MAG: TetR family transcriptional regulator [Anaerolineae bacterium]|nr:TetR family transcriptional regulator [Anaerolineae bacterium]
MKRMGLGESLATRQCLLEAAQRLFAARGYHGASIRDIVQACGVSNAALYYHFGSKKDLYFEVLGEYVADAVAQLRNADPGEGTCRSRLSSVALAYAQLILESQNVLQTLLRDVSQFDQDEIARLIPDLGGQIPAVFVAILEDGIAAGELQVVHTQRTGILLMGMVNAMTVRRLHAEVETTLQHDVDLVIQVLFEGIV